MSHGGEVARDTHEVPAHWAAISAIGAPQFKHRARRHVRLYPLRTQAVKLPISLSTGSTRLQIEIDTTWPAILAFERIGISHEPSARLEAVDASRLEIFNGFRVSARGSNGTSILCLGGTLAIQVLQIDAATFGVGAELMLLLRRYECAPLSYPDPFLEATAYPERGIHAGLIRLAARAARLGI